MMPIEDAKGLNGTSLFRRKGSREIFQFITLANEEITGSCLVVYRSLDSGKTWAASGDTFFNGDFERIK